MLSGEVRVAVDEYEREGTTVITALIVPVERLPRFEREWARLQQEMRVHLLRHYPFAEKGLAGGRLPEIHAVELYQSTGLFRNDPARDPSYWRQHRQWLTTAVEIIIRARPQILTRRWRPENTQANLDLLGLPSQTFARNVPFKKMQTKMDRLFMSPYVWLLNHTISFLEEHFTHHALHGSLLCDQHDDGRGFSLLKTFEIARRLNPHPAHLPAPVFSASHEHSLLQAVDVVCYILGSVFHAEGKGTLPPKDVGQWAVSLSPFLLGKPEGPSAYDWKKATARLFEILIAHSGGSNEYRQKLEAALPQFLESILLEGDNLVMNLNGDGIFFGPEMYKPPSEDGDLSKDKVSPTEANPQAEAPQ
ncbi:hypothetical protein ACFSR9_08735 [Deinococcus taklimakanensis]|uniref:Uncharacterized protein n=1 Tax=Deinococcus taklimakanensis TaxID=536443 RepID=A0ABW5P2J6_9DEIO